MAKRIYRFEEVRAVYPMAGTYDLCVRIKSRSMKDISSSYLKKLSVIDGVQKAVTVFIMRKYKEQGVILVGDETDERLVVIPESLLRKQWKRCRLPEYGSSSICE